jgi:hypothetical protein
MCRWTLGTIERRCEVTVLDRYSKVLLGPDSRVTAFSETVTRKSFLGPESGNSNILLLLFSCTNKRTCGDI